MKSIKTYTTRLAAELARLPLESAGIPSLILGVELGMEGGAVGVRLLVPDGVAGAALALLEGHDRTRRAESTKQS